MDDTDYCAAYIPSKSCCDAPKFVESDGTVVCESCGTEHDAIIDSGAEWRHYGADDRREDPTRCGKPVNELLPESSYGSCVQTSKAMNKSMRKMACYMNWNSMPSHERTQYRVFEHIQNICHIHGFPRAVIQDAVYFYKKMADEVAVRGKNKDGMIASAVYMACQFHKCPKSMAEISGMFNYNVASTAKGCKRATEVLASIPIAAEWNPADFVLKLCSELDMDGLHTKLCMFATCQWQAKKIFAENNPQTIAATLVFLVIDKKGLPITKTALAKASGVSSVSITKCYAKVEPHAAKLLPTGV